MSVQDGLAVGDFFGEPPNGDFGPPFLGAVLVVGNGASVSTAAEMRRYTRAFVQDFYRGGRGANLHQLVHQVVRHAVKVRVESHVIVDVDAGTRPLAQIEWLNGQRF